MIDARILAHNFACRVPYRDGVLAFVDRDGRTSVAPDDVQKAWQKQGKPGWIGSPDWKRVVDWVEKQYAKLLSD